MEREMGNEREDDGSAAALLAGLLAGSSGGGGGRERRRVGVCRHDWGAARAAPEDDAGAFLMSSPCMLVMYSCVGKFRLDRSFCRHSGTNTLCRSFVDTKRCRKNLHSRPLFNNVSLAGGRRALGALLEKRKQGKRGGKPLDTAGGGSNIQEAARRDIWRRAKVRIPQSERPGAPGGLMPGVIWWGAQRGTAGTFGDWPGLLVGHELFLLSLTPPPLVLGPAVSSGRWTKTCAVHRALQRHDGAADLTQGP
jgi:hypothetical protein